MPQVDWNIVLGMGGFFIILGIALLAGGRREEKSYYNSLVDRPDVREYIEHTPAHPEPIALKIGGRISIAVGLVLLAIGGGFKLWG